MGSEMCIRDSLISEKPFELGDLIRIGDKTGVVYSIDLLSIKLKTCLLYTSDAADERSSVDLGGRRIIKKKTIVDPDRIGTIYRKIVSESNSVR